MRSADVRCGRLRLWLLLCGAPNNKGSGQQERKRNRFVQNLLSLQNKIHRELLEITLFKTCDRIDRNVSAPAKLSTEPDRVAQPRRTRGDVQTAGDRCRRISDNYLETWAGTAGASNFLNLWGSRCTDTTECWHFDPGDRASQEKFRLNRSFETAARLRTNAGNASLPEAFQRVRCLQPFAFFAACTVAARYNPASRRVGARDSTL